MTITVIIPTLNEASTIATTIRHTAQLGFDEIVVVDGESSDQTRTIVDSLESGTQPSLDMVRLLTVAPGRASQLNAGAKAARGDVLLFLHADTMLPNCAEQHIESALADPLVVGGRFDVQFDSLSILGRMIGTFMNVRSRLTRISTGDQAMFVRRHVFERLGGFSDIPIMEDIEFSIRLKRTGATIALHDRVTTSFRRWEQRGSVHTILLMWALRFLYWIGVSPHRLQRFYAAVR
ncbi:MAG TPA: TIGR04283 family arsenosugar biosynthesis glycosyltransferase [Nitrospira sp.]|nr:TIGR04283 family arsenosugar biosynthesis glycosyltransferase [Nitrospira sp.]